MLTYSQRFNIGTMNTEHVSAQTSVPEWLMTYCRLVSDIHYQRKLNVMYVHMLRSFLAYAPWKSSPPYEWRSAKIHPTGKTGFNKRQSESGWLPMNMVLPIKLVDQIRETIDCINDNPPPGMKRSLSIRTFLYTAVCWWTDFIYPYAESRFSHHSEPNS